MLNELDLFAGIGGIALGLKRAGLCRTVCYVENDPYAQAVLQARMRDGSLDEAPIWDDVTTFDGEAWRGVVDLVAGGFPCQDISVAGKGAGINGARSGLWGEMWRIICEVRPRLVFVENVPALLGRGLGRVLGDLAASGYDAEWDCIPASALGAHHQRDRIWIVAYSNSGGFCEQGVRTKQSGRTETISASEAMADAESSRLSQRRQTRRSSGPAKKDRPRALTGPERRGGSWWSTEPDVGRVAHGISSRVDRLKCLGNAVVPQVVEWIGQRIRETLAC